MQTSIYKENPLHKSDNLVKLEQLQGSTAITFSCTSSNQSPAPSASSRDSLSSNQSERSSGKFLMNFSIILKNIYSFDDTSLLLKLTEFMIEVYIIY